MNSLPSDWSAVAQVYADGGVLLRNPSPDGGTFAAVWVNKIGGRVGFTTGSVTPADLGRPWVSNNLTEVLALVAGLEPLPAGWAGEVFSDSLNAIRAVRDCETRPNPDWLPAGIWDRVRGVRRRLGALSFVLLGGHPSKEELAAGKRKDGKPVSVHNVHCDKLCGEVAAAMLTQKRKSDVRA